MHAVRTSQWPLVLSGAEVIRLGQIQSESSSGPKIGAEQGVIDEYFPPVEPPCLRAFRLLSCPAEDARDVVDDLPRAERALGAGARLAVLSEGSLHRVCR